MSDEKPVRVILWCVPRTGSTAFTKCMSGIEGMDIWFELYGMCRLVAKQYKQLTGKEMPATYEGNEEAYDLAAAELSRFAGTKLLPERMAYGNVQRRYEQADSKYVFGKEISYGVSGEETRRYIPAGYRHAFLIRHPVKVYTSYRKAGYQQLLKVGVLSDEDREDPDKFDLEKADSVLPSSTFFQDQHSLWKHFRESGIEPEPVVIDVDDLLANPDEVLPKFCRAVGLPYSDSLLTWDASLDVVDDWKSSGKTKCRDIVVFYETAMKSSCFFPPKEPLPRDQLSPDVIKLSSAAMPFYEELRQHKI